MKKPIIFQQIVIVIIGYDVEVPRGFTVERGSTVRRRNLKRARRKFVIDLFWGLVDDTGFCEVEAQKLQCSIKYRGIGLAIPAIDLTYREGAVS